MLPRKRIRTTGKKPATEKKRKQSARITKRMREVLERRSAEQKRAEKLGIDLSEVKQAERIIRRGQRNDAIGRKIAKVREELMAEAERRSKGKIRDRDLGTIYIRLIEIFGKQAR